MKGSNIGIGVRLGCAFFVIMLLMFVVGGTAVVKIGRLDSEIEGLVTDKYPKVVMLEDVKNHVNVIARAIRNMVIVDVKEESDKEAKRIVESNKAVAKILEDLQKVVRSPAGKERLKAVLDSREAYQKDFDVVLKLLEANEKDKAKQELLTNVRKTQATYFGALDKMIEHQGKGVEAIGAKAHKDAGQSRNLIIGLLIVAIIASVLLAGYIVRSITQPVAHLLEINNKLAEGDLSVEIDVTGQDEIGRLAESSRRVVVNMKEILSNVADTSGQVAAASHQLQRTAEQIATGAEEVASQTSTVATASEEMSATSSDIARNCSMAADSSQQSCASAQRGDAVVQETTAVMVRITERVKESAKTVGDLGVRSEQIGQIVGTIEDIADQTNLLALNAAIEAARAGEQGRGFAVVADEVRALAERTTRATKEISDMIKAIQSETKEAVHAMEEGVLEVEAGAVSSGRSSDALQEIMQQINEVTMQISQIATAAEQQTATTTDITMNVQQITDVVHQTARGAGETAAASAQLASSAMLLQNLVGKFKLS